MNLELENQMGGFGSGQRGANTITVEECLVLDMAAVIRHARGLETSGDCYGTYQITLQAHPDYGEVTTWPTGSPTTWLVQLSGAEWPHYQLTPTVAGYGGAQWGDLCRMPLEWGGSYWLFRCPRCDVPCRKLYYVVQGGPYPGLFACRQCHDLRYSCQREQRAERLLRKMRKLRHRAGARGLSVAGPPKGMRLTTHLRLMEQADGVFHEALGPRGAVHTTRSLCGYDGPQYQCGLEIADDMSDLTISSEGKRG